LKSSNIFLDKNFEVEAIGDFYLGGITGMNIDEFDLNSIKILPPEFVTLGKSLD